MRVLVTGGAGFLGSHTVELLLAEGCHVTVVDDLSSGMVANVPQRVRLIPLDVCNDLEAVFAQVRPEAVVHLAAQVSVPNSVLYPERDLAVNVGGTIRVMEAAARTGVRKVVTVSSAAVYGMPALLPVREESPTRALSPYGLSKLTAERYVRLLGGLRGVPYTILRPANLFGPRQTTVGEGAVVPAFLTRFLTGQDPLIHGDGSQTRDFVYVTDMARAIHLCLSKADGMTINISSGVGTSVNSLWATLATLLGWKSPPVYASARIGDIPHSVLANERAREQLGWTVQVGLVEGLTKTLAWNSIGQVAGARHYEQ